jgi:hypothetical protein
MGMVLLILFLIACVLILLGLAYLIDYCLFP